jgi:hypothetical protein
MVATASKPQIGYIRDLLHQRVVDVAFASRCRERLAAGSLTKGDASRTIDYLLRQPKIPANVTQDEDRAFDAAVQERERKQEEAAALAKAARDAAAAFDPQTLEIGIYEVNDKIYKVKQNRAKTRKYAEVLDFTVSEALRLTKAGSTINAEYVFERGAIFRIRPEHRITGKRAEELSIVFRRCIVCRRVLKAAASVARGIGPVCIKKV